MTETQMAKSHSHHQMEMARVDASDLSHSHLKQGMIGQLTKVFDKCCGKSIIFEPFMWLEQTHGIIFILTVCLPIVQSWPTNVNK